MAKPVKVRCLYEFNAENDAEISIKPGDIITVTSQEDEGWWEGELNGQLGLFPSNYVEAYVEQVADKGPKYPSVSPARKRKSESHMNKATLLATQKSQKNLNETAAPAQKAPVQQAPVQQAPVQTAGGGGGAKQMTLIPLKQAQAMHGAGAAANQGGATPAGGAKPVAMKDVKVEMKSGGGQPTSAAQSNALKGSSAVPSPTPAKVTVELKTRFGAWGSNLAKISAMCMVLFGMCGLAWGIVFGVTNKKMRTTFIPVLTTLVAIYSILLAGFIFRFEAVYGQSRSGLRVPVRGFFYALLAVPFFMSWPSFLVGIFLSTTAVVNAYAAFIGEEYQAPPEVVAKAKESVFKQATNFWDGLRKWIAIQREQNKVGVLFFIFLYVAANLAVFAHALEVWIPLAKAAGLSSWAPGAKGFGNLLDFNCSIILVPVMRTMLRYLYNLSTADQGLISRFIRAILQVVPIDKNITFHKTIAKVIVVCAACHTLIHFINYAKKPDLTEKVFGPWPWISGGIICFTMLMIYSTAYDNTKRGQFELFWYNHHFFILFFAFILSHETPGKKLPRNFWRWFIGPGLLYLAERAMRVARGREKVVILSVTNMKPDVLSLEFSKEGILSSPYKEGQYLFLNCPTIAYFQWHPFTISSAPQEDTVTVHIRVCGEGSWTQTLRDYLAPMGAGRSFFELDRAGPDGRQKVKGKILGPNGLQMIHLDGPHSAPTQHIGEYSYAMVIGAGIGVTPVSSTLKSVVYHKWKFGMGQCFPDHAYFVWVCAYKDIPAFRWLIRIVKDAQDEVVHMRTHNPQTMATKTFEFHIYVTSAPKDAKAPNVVVDDEVGFWGVPYKEEKVHIEKTRADFSLLDLYRTMLAPPAHAQLEDIHIWNGRPAWDTLFKHVSERHPRGEIGVAFCGNPMIGRDLRDMCHKHSHGRPDGIFKLHKENF